MYREALFSTKVLDTIFKAGHLDLKINIRLALKNTRTDDS
jgi:hypothetical protein